MFRIIWKQIQLQTNLEPPLFRSDYFQPAAVYVKCDILCVRALVELILTVFQRGFRSLQFYNRFHHLLNLYLYQTYS